MNWSCWSADNFLRDCNMCSCFLRLMEWKIKSVIQCSIDFNNLDVYFCSSGWKCFPPLSSHLAHIASHLPSSSNICVIACNEAPKKRYNTPKVETCRFSAGYTRSMTIGYMWWNQPGSSFYCIVCSELSAPQKNYGTNWASTVPQCRKLKVDPVIFSGKNHSLLNISHHPISPDMIAERYDSESAPKKNPSALFPCD